MKGKIVWLTADYFLDVDIQIVKELSKHFEIHWFIFYGNNGIPRNTGLTQSSSDNLIIKEHFTPFKSYHPGIIVSYFKLLKEMRAIKADLAYIDFIGSPFFHFMILAFIDKKKVVQAAHNVIDYDGWHRRSILKRYLNMVFTVFQNFHIFSRLSYSYFVSKYSKKDILLTPLALKDYGESEMSPPKDGKIHLLFFGNVKKNKRLDILIKAYKGLDNTIKRKLRLSIVGKCTEIPYYKDLIAEEPLIDFRPYRVKDEEVADIFCSHHFLVLPYENVAQSGPHMIAYNYHLPVIASNISDFVEKVVDNKTGYLFKANDEVDLRRVLTKIVFEEKYELLKRNLEKVVEQEYSIKSISVKYIDFFNRILKK